MSVCTTCGSNDVQMIINIIKSGTVETTGTEETSTRFDNGTWIGGYASATKEINTISRSNLAEELNNAFGCGFQKPVYPTYKAPRSWIGNVIGLGATILGIFFGIMAWWLGVAVFFAVLFGGFYVDEKLAGQKGLDAEEAAKRAHKAEQLRIATLTMQGNIERSMMYEKGYFCHRCGNKFIPDVSNLDKPADSSLIQTMRSVISEFAERFKKDFSHPWIHLAADIDKVELFERIFENRFLANTDDPLLFLNKVMLNDRWIAFFPSKLIAYEGGGDRVVHEIPYVSIGSVSQTPPTKHMLGKLAVNGIEIRRIDADETLWMADLIRQLAALHQPQSTIKEDVLTRTEKHPDFEASAR